MKSFRQFSRRGSVLVAVLGIVALMAALMVSFMQEASDRVRYNGLAQNGGDLRERAYSALDLSLASIAQIAEIDNGLRASSQGWGDPLKYAGFTPYDDCEISVTCTDECAKFPLATMTEQQIAALFEELDVSSTDSGKLAEAVLDWMDNDDTARLDSVDGDDYENATIPCKPSNMVPRTWEEFRLMDHFPAFFIGEDGRPTQLFTDFMSEVSLYNSDAVNINDAPEKVVDTLAEMGDFDADQVVRKMAGSDGIRGTSDDLVLTDGSEFGDSVPVLVAYSTQLLRLRVVASRGDTHFSLDVLVKYTGPAKTTNATTGTSTRLSGGYDDFPENPETALSYPFSIVQLTETRVAP